MKAPQDRFGAHGLKSERPEIERLRRAVATVASTGDLEKDRLAVHQAVLREFGISIEPTTYAFDELHLAPELVALIPRDLTDPPVVTKSETATRFTRRIRRMVTGLGFAPRDVLIASGIGGTGRGTVTVTLYSLPGIPAKRLVREWPPLNRRYKARSQETTIAGKSVRMMEYPDFSLALWARDGILIEASGSDRQRLERVVSRLP